MADDEVREAPPAHSEIKDTAEFWGDQLGLPADAIVSDVIEALFSLESRSYDAALTRASEYSSAHFLIRMRTTLGVTIVDVMGPHDEWRYFSWRASIVQSLIKVLHQVRFAASGDS